MITAAFMLGFLGSVHCLGMCGPLMLGLPGMHLSTPSFVFTRLAHQAGRILVYSLMGAIVGGLGEAVIPGSAQRTLSLIAGSAILLVAILAWKGRGMNLPAAGPWVKIVSRFRRTWAPALQKSSPLALFLWGALNGLLPCGLVYAGLAGALASGSALAGALTMAAFGAGTLPAMLATALSGKNVGAATRQKLQRLAPAGAAVVGVLLVFRGLALGIPWLSPATFGMEQVSPCCAAAAERAGASSLIENSDAKVLIMENSTVSPHQDVATP